jgi:hypothetical protein
MFTDFPCFQRLVERRSGSQPDERRGVVRDILKSPIKPNARRSEVARGGTWGTILAKNTTGIVKQRREQGQSLHLEPAGALKVVDDSSAKAEPQPDPLQPFSAFYFQIANKFRRLIVKLKDLDTTAPGVKMKHDPLFRRRFTSLGENRFVYQPITTYRPNEATART